MQQNSELEGLLAPTRRYFLGQAAGVGLGNIALNGLASHAVANESAGISSAVAPPSMPKAKRVILLTMSGGPSQIDLFDHKPDLHRLEGTELPDSVRRGQRLTGMTKGKKQLVMSTRSKFYRCGDSGATVSEWLPNIGAIADDLCFVKSMHTDYINHAPAMTFYLTGHQIPGRPTVGAWVSYGLGSPNRDLPEFIVLVSKMQRPSDQPLYEYYWGSGFLPTRYQGVKLRSGSEPVLYLNNPEGVSTSVRRSMLDSVAALNRLKHKSSGDPEVDTRIRQYEMAYRMQSSVPDLVDLSDESESTFKMYGEDARRPGSYAANCILARRLAERDVRFIQLLHPDWDHHSKLTAWCPARCRDTDQATAALITDLKQRGLLDDTLVVWGGEFGRGVAGQGDFRTAEAGRDHHPGCFTIFMAGGGVKAGTTYGSTDDFSYNVAENGVSVHDLHATVLHLLGIDHRSLTYRFQGLDQRLSGVEPASVVHGLLS